MIKKCGLLFNRHNWVYVDKSNRICDKCGECQTEGFSGGWITTDFDSIMANVERGNKWKREREESRKKALNFLKEK